MNDLQNPPPELIAVLKTSKSNGETTRGRNEKSGDSFLLAADPVIHLDLKHVRGSVAEDRAPLGAKIEIAVGIVSRPALCPYEEHSGAGSVFPPHHGVTD